MRTRLIIIFSCITLALNAQVFKHQGYMGKKFALKYKMGLSTGTIYFSGANPIKLCIPHNFEVEYSMSKRWSVLANYQLQSSSKSYGSSINNSYVNYNPNSDYNRTIMNNSFLLKFRRYNQDRNSYSPQGIYFGINMGVLFNKTSGYYSEEDIFGQSFLIPIETKITHPIIGFELGRQYVFAKRIILDGGININFPITSVIRGKNGYKYDYSSVNYNEDEAQYYKDVNINIIFMQIIQLHIGVGILLF